MKCRRRVGHAKKQGRARCCIDNAVPSIQRRREETPRLPLEGLFLIRIVAAPDFGGAAPLEHVKDFLVHVLFRRDRTRSGHLDHVHSLKPGAAVELDECALSAHTLPRCQSQVADVIESHRAAMDRETLLLHINLIGSRLPYPTLGANEILRHVSLPPSIQVCSAS